MPCDLVQYTDDTFLFVSSKNFNLGINILENKDIKTEFNTKNFNLGINFLENNDTKTEFIIFCKKSKNSLKKKFRLQMNDKFYEPSNRGKYLGVYLVQNLTFQEEVKNILRNMAFGIKTLYSIRE